ncbi:hypothetical protein OS12_39990 [Dickeya oryzae]
MPGVKTVAIGKNDIKMLIDGLQKTHFVIRIITIGLFQRKCSDDGVYHPSWHGFFLKKNRPKE